MLRRLCSVFAFALFAGAVLLATAVPAGAQQLVDAGGESGSGGLAFVLFTVMVALCAGAMFYMDHVRRRRLQQEDDTPKP
jgi:hypothetical protein